MFYALGTFYQCHLTIFIDIDALSKLARVFGSDKTLQSIPLRVQVSLESTRVEHSKG